MATANQTKVVPYLLVLQSSSATSSLRREDTEDDYNYRNPISVTINALRSNITLAVTQNFTSTETYYYDYNLNSTTLVTWLTYP
ncbi:unnamed protein product [Rotaria sp. Silwood1]|nr:unnamed protein product [Rotaria sp. Silwood1]